MDVLIGFESTEMALFVLWDRRMRIQSTEMALFVLSKCEMWEGDRYSGSFI